MLSGVYMMRKLVFSIAFLLDFVTAAFSKDIVIEINGITVQNGRIYVAIYSNESDYKNKKYFMSFIKDPVNETINFTVDLPEEEYVVSVFQDVNNNGELDSGLFGIPKEPVGITNYSGKGIPGGFHKSKVPVNTNTTKITVNMGRI
jgi:uncharacterized protein (DUF2141 family)